ncbi:MAG: cation:proton antiporter [Actinobacteria bacterium]|nr:cation:proton antiporter [Actinomycetota bacterium]
MGRAHHALQLEAVLGAFIVGILVGEVKRFDHHVRRSFEQVTLAVFAPVFFATAGLRVDLGALFQVKVLSWPWSCSPSPSPASSWAPTQVRASADSAIGRRSPWVPA